MRMVTVCLRSEIEDCEAKRMVSSYWLSTTKDSENMRMISSYLFGPGANLHSKSGVAKN